jgi:HEAT repeat protein
MMSWGAGRPRLRVRTLLMLVACTAVFLAAWGEFRDPVRRWKRALRSDNESSRRWEAVAKGISGDVPGVDAGLVLQELLAALADPSLRVRETACHGLGRIGARATTAVADLARVVVNDREHNVRAAAVAALGGILETSKADGAREVAIPALVTALNDRTSLVRSDAAFALVRIGEGEPAVPVLIEGLHQQNPSTVSVSCWCLHKLGKKAEPAVPTLLGIAGDFEPWNDARQQEFCRKQAIDVLIDLGQEKALRETLEHAGDGQAPAVRDEALGLIEAYGLDRDE